MERMTVPLSPSRASDFKACPQLFKFRVIDRIPEPADINSARGTLVHLVLEKLMQCPADERSTLQADQILEEAWSLLKQDPELEGFEMSLEEEAGWLAEAQHLLQNYFMIEDPKTIEAHELEWWVEHAYDDMFLRGIIDRVEILEDGDWVLSDYKTGRSPSDTYALGAFFGLKFYALVCWRAFGKMPKQLRLMHLREPEVLTLTPTIQMLEGVEKQLEALARAIARAHDRDDWRPRPGALCNWCPHQAICPAFPDQSEVAAAPEPLPAEVH